MQLPDFLLIPREILDDKNLQPLDGYVFGVIYWFSKLKLEKCIASNKQISEMVKASQSGVANSISRLAKQKYVRVIMNSKTHQREELVPLIAFNRETTLTETSKPLTQMSNHPYSNEEQNNNINILKQEDTPYNPSTAVLPKKERWASCPVKVSPLKEKYKGGHEECREYLISWEQLRKRGFVSEFEQFCKIHAILKAGYDFPAIDRAIKDVERKFGRGNWDFERVAKWIEKGGTDYANNNTGGDISGNGQRISALSLLGH